MEATGNTFNIIDHNLNDISGAFDSIEELLDFAKRSDFFNDVHEDYEVIDTASECPEVYLSDIWHVVSAGLQCNTLEEVWSARNL